MAGIPAPAQGLASLGWEVGSQPGERLRGPGHLCPCREHFRPVSLTDLLMTEDPQCLTPET